jgi:hypothetical protein
MTAPENFLKPAEQPAKTAISPNFWQVTLRTDFSPARKRHRTARIAAQ